MLFINFLSLQQVLLVPQLNFKSREDKGFSPIKLSEITKSDSQGDCRELDRCSTEEKKKQKPFPQQPQNGNTTSEKKAELF